LEPLGTNTHRQHQLDDIDNINSTTTMVLHLSADEFLNLGLGIFPGFDERSQQRTCNATKLRRFKSNCGSNPDSCAQLFVDLQTSEAANIRKPNPVCMLMTLNWLRTYKTEEAVAGTFSVQEKTGRTWIWAHTHAIQALKAEKVSTDDVKTTPRKYTCTSILTDSLLFTADYLAVE
jgi:hypothetical protein